MGTGPDTDRSHFQFHVACTELRWALDVSSPSPHMSLSRCTCDFQESRMDQVKDFSLQSFRNHFSILSKLCPPEGVGTCVIDLGSFQKELVGVSFSSLGSFHLF